VSLKRQIRIALLLDTHTPGKTGRVLLFCTDIDLDAVERWMLRIVDVKAALEQRGYPAQLQAELHLELSDDVIPENTGRFVLTVADGQGAVSPGGSGELKLDIGGLAPLYTGLFNAHQLQMMGLLSGSAAGRAIATQMFAGIPPWTSDFF